MKIFAVSRSFDLCHISFLGVVRPKANGCSNVVAYLSFRSSSIFPLAGGVHGGKTRSQIALWRQAWADAGQPQMPSCPSAPK